MPIRKIGVIANARKEKAPECINRLRSWVRERGIEVILEKEIADKMGETGGVDRKELGALADLVIVFGGDGTLLMAARSVRTFHVPILGVNLGSFGYLTVVNLNEMQGVLERILEGDYHTDSRMMLDVAFHNAGGLAGEYSVLNDIVINRGNLSRMVEVETIVNDRYLTTYRADGLIISTPTGSTAYSLSAGGPIVSPELDSVIINPICPHTLTNRPVILPGNARLRAILWTKDQGAMLTLDGQISVTMKPGDSICVKKSKYTANLVASPERDHFQILRSKLGWGGLPSGAKRD
jgi:NAD+ kinase